MSKTGSQPPTHGERGQSTRASQGSQGGPGGQHFLTMPTEKPRDYRGAFMRLLRYLKPYRFVFLLVFFTAILGTGFNIIGPIFLGQGTTIIFEGMMEQLEGVEGASVDFDQIRQLLFFLVVVYFISAAFTYLGQYIMAGVVQKIVYNLREEVYNKLSRLPLSYFDTRSYGDIMSRFTNDMDLVGTTLQQTMHQFLTSVVIVTGILGLMLYISPLMTVIALVTLPLSYVITSHIVKISKKYFRERQRELGELSGQVEETFTGHLLVKTFSNEQKEIKQFKEINERLYQAGWRAHFISGLIMPLIGFVNNIGYVLICAVGGILVIRGTITIGNLQAFIQYSRQFREPIVQFAGIAGIIQSTLAAAERVFNLLDEEEEEPESPGALVLENPRGDVSLKQVKFSYYEDEPLMEDLNIEVQEGQTVAIVGPTGAGKTTLVNLLMRFYEIKGGKITVDGIDIRDLKRGSLRRTFGMVLQDTWLFGGTIRENIAYGKEGASFEEVVEAARAAYADHFIRTLPKGYETVINEDATNISQGQKQLLTIARAVIADPAILILDEATSNVDTRTELLIQKAMAKLMKGRTSFIIAHRLSTIHHADIILVMDDGKVIEKGTHTQLIEAQGFYADLYYSQFAGQDAEGSEQKRLA